MSDEEKNVDKTEDSDLNELLDSALEDFDKTSKLQAKKESDELQVKKDDGSPSTSTKDSKEETVMDDGWSQEFIKQTAEQFEKNLQNLMQNGGEFDSFQKMAQTVATAITDEGGDSDFQAAITQALKDLSATSENLQNSTPSIGEEELAAMFGQTSLDEATGDILPLMQGMIQSLLSKEVLYPSLKELVDKYPAWLEEKKSSLSTVDFERYSKQMNLMQKVCIELEKEKVDDSDATKQQRFEKTLALMQEMQSFGQPPEELIGEQLPLFQFDSEGNPIAPSLPPGFEQPQNCSVM